MIVRMKSCADKLLRLVLVILSWSAYSSTAEERYRDLVFTDVVVTTGVEYGAGLRDGGVRQTLLMDIYSPAGDTETRRPVVVLAFPGGFVDGARDDAEMVLMAERFARHGYVAASIDYRLIEGSPDTTDELEVSVLQAVHDMRAAVRFFREDAAGANLFGTDGLNVFGGGISAGAVMAGGAGTLDEGDVLSSNALEFLAANGGMAGNTSSNIEFSSRLSGVLQISGAIAELDWIDSNAPPIYAAHEEFDPIVPCGTSAGLGFAAFGLALVSSGACDMIPRARDLGVPTAFFFDDGALNHVGFSSSEFLEILDAAAAFFFTEVLQPKTLASAVLPGSRSVQVGAPATVFAAVINTAMSEATGCQVMPMTEVDATFSFQTASALNVPVGVPNAVFDIAGGATQNLIFTFTPSDDFSATNVYLRYQCEGGAAANNALGLNTLLLSADNNPVADVIGLTTVVDLAAELDAPALFAVGSANVGVEQAITVTLDDGGAGLPLLLQICRTDSATGACLESPAASSTLDYSGASTASFAVFVTATAPISNDPARHRIFVRFADAGGNERGLTSTAVRTQ